MIRILKTLGLAACAAMAMSAFFATGASAQHGGLGEFRSGLTTTNKHTATNWTATQYGSATENVFKAFSDKLNCTNTKTLFHGSTKGTDTTLSATATYEECSVLTATEPHGIARPVTVKMNGCTFQFNQPSMVIGSAHNTWTGTVDVVCSAGNSIEVTVFSCGTHTSHSGFSVCTEKIAAQKGKGPVEYHNVKGGTSGTGLDDITVTVRATGISVTKEGLCGAGSTNAAEYISNLTVRSEKHDLWIATHGQPNTPL
jgi:hypothetical protein